MAEHLTPDERRKIEEAFVNAEVDYRLKRRILMDGIPKLVVAYHLPFVDYDGYTQLTEDLRKLSGFDLSADGKLPVRTWLENAQFQFTGTSYQTLIVDLLEKVKSRSGSSPAPAHPPGTGATGTSQPAAGANVRLDRPELVVDGIDDMVPVGWLKLAACRAEAVARLKVPVWAEGSAVMSRTGVQLEGKGTGWLIGEKLLITNFHVIRARGLGQPAPSDEDLAKQVEGIVAWFDLDDDHLGGAPVAVASLRAFNESLDYAILELAPSAQRGSLPLATAPFQLSKTVRYSDGTTGFIDALNITQHPDGRAKMVAFRNNYAHSADATSVRYYTDTNEGSSGSPVFDDDWNVVALHRGAQGHANAVINGRRVHFVNLGTQAAAILEDVKRSNPTLFDLLGQKNASTNTPNAPGTQ